KRNIGYGFHTPAHCRRRPILNNLLMVTEQNKPRTTCYIIISSKPYRVGQWIPSDHKFLDK
ncbi:unnamed protein product, partial [Pocillopora meandrina]